VRTALHGLMLLLCFFCTDSNAFHAQTNSLQSPLTDRQTLRQVYFQITPATTSVDDLLADPLYHHSFRLLTPEQRLFFTQPDAVWLFARIQNTGNRAIHAVVEYDFPLADKIEIFQINRQNQDFELLSRTGNDYPFNERALPVRSFAVNLPLAAAEEVDLYIKVQDAAIVPSELLLWQYDHFIAVKQQQAMLDGLLLGFLLLLALYNLLLFARYHVMQYLYYAGFFLSFALVVAVLNGLAFALLWPGYPEINQAILYIAAGSSLLCLNMVVRYSIQSWFGFWWQCCSYISNGMALLLLFSPLFFDGQHRLYLLLFAVAWVVGANLIAALALSMRRQSTKPVKGLIWACVFTLFSALLLTLNLAGYLQADVNWSFMLFSILLLGLALAGFNLHQFKLTPDPSVPTRTELQHYYDIFHNAVEGMFVTTRDGRLLKANQALLAILGYQTMAQLKQAIAGTGMARFYADHSAHQQMLKQLEMGCHNSFEIRGLRGDNSPFWALMSVRLAASSGTQPAYVQGSVIDITEQKLAHEQLAYRANHDELTALHNRFYFTQQLQLLCDQTGADKGCLLYLELDQFSIAQHDDSYRAAEALLRQLGAILQRTAHHNGPLARLEHHAFGILLGGKSTNQAFALAYRIMDAIREFRFIWQEKIYHISVGIGIVELSQADNCADEILKKANLACRIAQEKGHNRIQLFEFNPEDNQRYQPEISWLEQLRHALKHDRFVLYQQPILALTQSVSDSHYELLLRLRGDGDTLITPASFLNSAERFGLMPQIDRWVIRQYFHWLQQHPEHLVQLSLCHINIAGSSLLDATFSNDVQQLFDRYQIPFSRICFEINESMTTVNPQQTLAFIQHFRAQGCQIAIDDFGSGFASFSYLKHFPADFIKIDGPFVRNALEDEYDKAVLQSLHDIAHSKQIFTVAECVESPDMLAALQRIGINYAQGYTIARPMPLNALIS
jgi:diguanylate cyclase (GGDEF)-like protein/PAS domain S-box-containing protein